MRPLMLCVFFVVFSAPAAADTMRCGDRLVHVEDTVGEVLAACGEPAWRVERIASKPDFVIEQEQDWTYDFGPNRLLQTLVFRRGRLAAIEAGGYGTASGRLAPAP